MRAVDGDRAIGHPIVYSIVSGPDDIFSISPDTGVVYTQTLLDRESPRSSNGAYILGIQGQAHQSYEIIRHSWRSKEPAWLGPCGRR